MTRLLLALFAAVTIGGVGLLLPGEYRTHQFQSRSFRSLAAEPSDGYAVPASTTGRVSEMRSCQSMLVSLEALVSPKASRDDVAVECLGRAERVLADSPTMAMAHLARSVALSTLDRPADEARRLSAELAPNENWIVARRLASSFFFDQITDSGLDELDRADLRQLLRSDFYRSAIVDLYFLYPDRREWIAQTLQGQDGRDQRAFLAQIRTRSLDRGAQ